MPNGSTTTLSHTNEEDKHEFLEKYFRLENAISLAVLVRAVTEYGQELFSDDAPEMFKETIEKHKMQTSPIRKFYT